MTLGAYLESCAARRREAGVYDCCTFPADWAILKSHSDPMAAWRGSYDSDADGEALIADAGSLASLFDRGMAAAGIPAVAGLVSRAGDIGVIELAGQQAGAIFTGKRWAFVPERGLGFVSLDRESIVRMWRP